MVLGEGPVDILQEAFEASYFLLSVAPVTNQLIRPWAWQTQPNTTHIPPQDTERARVDAPLLVYFPDVPNGQSYSWEQGAGDSIQVSHMVGRDPTT